MEEYNKNNEANNPNLEDKDLEVAKKLVEAVRSQIEEENEKIIKLRNKMYRESDFKVSKFKAYLGPNYYMDKKALVFNIFIAPTGDSVDFYREHISKVLPKFANDDSKYVIDLFCEVLLETLRMDINLFINDYEISYDDDEYVVAIEYLDKNVAIDCVYLVSDWFYALSNDRDFDFLGEWKKLQDKFDKTFYGGPTLYSLIEAGLKRNIPVNYLYEENQFMWGYGKKQLRGRSTTFHIDSIKDTEFTMYKDMVGEFLDMCGFPTPKTINTFSEDEAVEAALKLGFPCVLKPVAGHKGQGVTTGIRSEKEVREAYQKIIKLSQEQDVPFDGALVQTQIFGTDHRLLSVEGKFAAALQRVPAYVDGDGTHTIEELIAIENDKVIRLDNARSPLCKIKIDEDLINYLELQNLKLSDIPKEGERITLRRVANISAGGVSINVTDKIHPDNIQLVEDIASFFKVKCLGIDVLAEDISKSWKEGNFGIIEINAGPGVFMHLAPAYGGSIDIPGLIMESHFGKDFNSRIPIIMANYISKNLYFDIVDRIMDLNYDAHVGAVLEDGVYFNKRRFHQNEDNTQNEKIVIRHPKTDFAILTYNKDQIFDYGLLCQGADIVILDEASYAEESVLIKQLLSGAPLIEVVNGRIDYIIDDETIDSYDFETNEEKDSIILSLIERTLPDLLRKY